ncbi:MAG: pyrroline-5-carboxylate reductase, partial [candidate division GAL15 bacterium]
GEDPAELRRRVTSPGGTTIAGLGVLEEHGVRGALVEAVQRAAQRARELAS